MATESDYDYWEIEFSEILVGLIQASQKNCVVACCGIEAFDFSPLHAASYLAGISGGTSPKSIAQLTKELDRLAKRVARLRAGPGGIVCYTHLLNENFTKESFQTFLKKLETAIRLAPDVEAFARLLQESATV